MLVSTSTTSFSMVDTNTGVPDTSSPSKRKSGGHNPKIHGSFDPNTD
jgi:hypothetical protein